MIILWSALAYLGVGFISSRIIKAWAKHNRLSYYRTDTLTLLVLWPVVLITVAWSWLLEKFGW